MHITEFFCLTCNDQTVSCLKTCLIFLATQLLFSGHMYNVRISFNAPPDKVSLRLTFVPVIQISHTSTFFVAGTGTTTIIYFQHFSLWMDMFEENKSWKKCTIKMTKKSGSQESAMQKKKFVALCKSSVYDVRSWVLGTGFSWIYTGFSAIYTKVLCWSVIISRVCDFLKRVHFTQCQCVMMTQKIVTIWTSL